ncbi:MAG: dihydrolipoyl dehydrogenase [Clostridium sp.]|nr:dihydrolipoyl dehydrogenase [Prevotella sp.]MCM1429183.1 dihydrolipoyl dehydrogenase [Clostridium sp.]MCM1475843.1 dihydrolipoyl dehydrogenase [Muribaculaceae bacterium]
MSHSDIIIIGAGPGGYECALDAAKRGLSVTLFNGDRLGGTCLNEGCIPTKCLCRNAEVISTFKNGDEFGIDEFTFSVDYKKILERKNGVTDKLREGIAAMLKSAKVNVVDARASFKDAKTVEANGEEYTADNIIIATGSTSRSLPIPGHDLDCVMDSTDILSIDYVPESLTIIGGGVIGMEFASIFSQLGSRVTVIEFMKQILPPFDSDIAKRLKQALSKKGVEIITSAAAKTIEKKAEGEIIVTYECKGKEASVVSTDLLMAVGRAPRIDGLNLEATGVEYSPRGIVVDDNMRTNVPGIYAIGDVNARMMLAHVATFQGFRALNAIQGKEDRIRFDLVPSAVFTVPECGMVGLTEEQCKAQGIEIEKGQSFFRANGKSLALGEPDGLVKLLFRKDNGLLVGAHIMGVEAADLTQQCADMMNYGATRESMRQIIFSHPSVSEVIMAALH